MPPGRFPLDTLLGLQSHDRSPATEEVACLAGVQTSFAETADKVLSRLTGSMKVHGPLGPSQWFAPITSRYVAGWKSPGETTHFQ